MEETTADESYVVSRVVAAKTRKIRWPLRRVERTMWIVEIVLKLSWSGILVLFCCQLISSLILSLSRSMEGVVEAGDHAEEAAK